MRLGTAAEDAEASEVEIEQVWRGVDAAQCAVEAEVVALVTLDEAPRQHNLEHVAALAVSNAPPDVRLVLLVGECGLYVAHGVEGIFAHAAAVHGLQHLLLHLSLLRREVLLRFYFHNLQQTVMVVEHNHYLI